MNPQQYYFIVIAGNIGVGKSTLTEMLSSELGWAPFLEAVVENPYLADFYTDMKRWSFHSQVFFLSRRLRHHYQLLQEKNSVIQDRSVYEDAEIFAENLYRQGAMSARDHATYRGIYQVVTEILPPPNLIVYLRASVRTLQARIARRGRQYEQSIDPAYLAQLNSLYDEWAVNFRLSPVHSIDTDPLDFVQRPKDFSQIVQRVKQALKHTAAAPTTS